MVTFGKKVITPLGLVVFTTIVAALLIMTKPDTQAELQPLSPARVYTTEVKMMDVQPISRFTGNLQPARKASLRMEVSGNIVKRNVEPGQYIKQGDILVQVDDGDFVDAVAEAQALYTQEKKAIERDRSLLKLISDEKEILEREVERQKKLGRDSLASKSSLDASLRLLLQQQEEQTRLEHSVVTSDARLQARSAALNMAERNLERTRLAAPFDGVINSVAVDLGDHITSGQIAVELVQLDMLDLYIEITGEIANQLQMNQEVNVLVNEKQIKGNIFALATDPDPLTHTHALRVRLPGEGLYPGQLAVAELPGRFLHDVAVVPVSSILQDEGKAFVFTVDNNVIARKEVSLITRQNDLQVISGVTAGTRIVSKDVTVIADGQEVHVE